MKFPAIGRVIVGTLLFAHLIVLSSFQFNSADTWWHLKEGELYVKTLSLPEQDPFAFTTIGREWIKYSWLSDILFYLIFHGMGIPGLIVLRVLVLLVLAALLYRTLRACGVHPLCAVVLVFLMSLAVRFRLFIRPEILSYPLLLASVGVLLRFQGASPRLIYLLLPVQVLWTNVHASFVFGLGLPALVLAANFLPINRSEPGWGRLRVDGVRLRHLAITTALLPLVSLLNPQGVRLLSFPFRQNRMVRLTAFYEWREVWKLPAIDPAWWEVVIVFSLIIVLFVAVSAFLLIWEGRFDPVGWGVLLSLGTYAAFRNRAVPFFVLTIVPLLALALVRLAGHPSLRAPWVSLRRLEAGALLGCIALLGAALLDQSLLNYRVPLGLSMAPNLFPEGAAAFLERHGLDGKVFNSYEFGGYLIWRRWPANQVIIDGRYDAILFDEALLSAHMEAEESPSALNRITDAYGVEIMVLHAHAGHPRRMFPVYPGWARVYWDHVAEVFVRRAGRYFAAMKRYEYELTGSTSDTGYLTRYRGDPQKRDEAIAELHRAAADNPENLLAWLGLAQEYQTVGPEALARRADALTHAVGLLAGKPMEGRARAELAEAFLQLGRNEDAAAAAREALRADERLLLPYWVLAGAAERGGSFREARDQLRILLQRIDADHPMAAAVRERLQALEGRLRIRDGG